jgi:phosphoglycolate phosphatase-like HAD superfamily hydrolase
MHQTFALFDFDGTISTFRTGWQIVMTALMIEKITPTPRCEPLEELKIIVRDAIDFSTGTQTIYQMIALEEMVRERGGDALTALEYKEEFNTRLLKTIAHRVDGVRSGSLSRDAMIVPGALMMLEALRARGVRCYLASGTDQPYVLAEAAALGVSDYFEHIYGAQMDYKSFSKRQVIERLITENQLEGEELVGFGDGFVEIEELVAAGGIAVGVASEEHSWSGPDAWKRQRLIEAGADYIIPDYRDHEKLIAHLFAEEEV